MKTEYINFIHWSTSFTGSRTPASSAENNLIEVISRQVISRHIFSTLSLWVVITLVSCHVFLTCVSPHQNIFTAVIRPYLIWCYVVYHASSTVVEPCKPCKPCKTIYTSMDHFIISIYMPYSIGIGHRIHLSIDHPRAPSYCI